MARFRPIDDSPNERAPGPEWGSQVLEAYRDDANRAIANREFELTMQQRGMETATDIAMRLQQQAAQEKAQRAAFEQQKEMENLRTRNDIYKEREQYNFQANKELERIRTAQRDLELQPWPENVKAQMRGVLKAQEMGIKADPKNFAPKPPPAADQWAESRVIDKENGIVSYRQPDGKWEVKPLPKPETPKKAATPKPPDMMKIRQQAITELNPDGTATPSATDIRKKMREIIETSDPEMIMADEDPTSQPAPVATQPTSQPAASNFAPGKPFRTPMDAVAVVAASQQQPGTVPPARVMQALEYLLPIKDSLEPRETAVLENAKLQLIQKGKSAPLSLSPEEVTMLRRLAKGG